MAEIKVGLLVYPPYAESKEVGGGIIVDLINSLKLDGVKFMYFPAARAFQSFFANEVDMVLTSDIAMSDQILENNNFIRLAYGNTHFFYLKNKFIDGVSISNLNSLKGVTVGVLRGVKKEITDLEDLGFKIVLANGPEHGIELLSRERIDLLHMSKVPINYMLGKKKGQFAKIAVTPSPMYITEIGLMYRKSSNPEVLKFIDLIEKKLTTDEYRNIIEKYIQNPGEVQETLP